MLAITLHPSFLQEPPVPFEEKLHAIAYVNSNCGAQSGRSEIMRKLIALGKNAKVQAPLQLTPPASHNSPQLAFLWRILGRLLTAARLCWGA
jgi:hypothetical protein